jgi:glycosyltransferase involved in cell wall biosynthesis
MKFFMRGYRIRILRPLFHWLSYITNKARLIRIVQEEKVTLIHAHHVQHSSYIAHRLSRKLNIPYVVTSRKIFSSIHSKQAKQDLNHAEAVISINHFYKKIIDQLVPSNSSHLLPHGLDAAFLTAEDKLLQPERGVVKLISISRLLPLKNIEHVLLALEKSNLPFVYDIYGDGPDFSRLINILAHLKIKDNVRFMGHVPHSEVPPILSQYDIFVLPSYPEGLGRVYLEAMGMGLPVIASKNTGIDGFITNGVSGMLVHPKNIDELSEALNKLIIDVPFRLDIAAAGRALMHQFSWDKIIPKLHTIYSSAISNYKKK